MCRALVRCFHKNSPPAMRLPVPADQRQWEAEVPPLCLQPAGAVLENPTQQRATSPGTPCAAEPWLLLFPPRWQEPTCQPAPHWPRLGWGVRAPALLFQSRFWGGLQLYQEHPVGQPLSTLALLPGSGGGGQAPPAVAWLIVT